MATTRKVIIIGSGPGRVHGGDLRGARQPRRRSCSPGIQAGGQLMLTTLVENYPGFVDGIDGPPLMETFAEAGASASAPR